MRVLIKFYSLFKALTLTPRREKELHKFLIKVILQNIGDKGVGGGGSDDDDDGNIMELSQKRFSHGETFINKSNNSAWLVPQQ